MSNSMPAKAKVGVPGKTVNVDTRTYFTAKRMEAAGMLKRGQALMLAATLQTTTKPENRSKRK